MSVTYREVIWKRYGMAHIVSSDNDNVLCGANTYHGRAWHAHRFQTPEPDDHRCRKCITKAKRLGITVNA